jgi:hypothetical protein
MKMIPITRGMRRNQVQAGIAVLACCGRAEKGLMSRIMDGKILFLAGAQPPLPAGHGAYAGSLTSIALGWVPWPISTRYEPGRELAVIGDFEKQVRQIADRVIHRDVRFFGHMPTWTWILFEQMCAAAHVPEDGGVTKIWPNLEVFVYGGMNFAPLRPSIDRFFRPDRRPRYYQVYPATEGFIAIQPNDGVEAMELLVANEIFYEFVPLEEWGKPGAPRLMVDEVEPDVPYVMVLSTSWGLWAYDLGDIVRFASVHPPEIVFAGRHEHFMNSFGEHMIEQEVARAVAAAAEATGSRVMAFTAAPRYPGPGHRAGAIQVLVEFAEAPEGGAGAFAAQIDRILQSINRNYMSRRRGDLGMTCAEVVPVPPGTFYAWMKSRGKLGGQHKVPPCANDRRYADSVLESVAASAGPAADGRGGRGEETP